MPPKTQTQLLKHVCKRDTVTPGSRAAPVFVHVNLFSFGALSVFSTWSHVPERKHRLLTTGGAKKENNKLHTPRFQVGKDDEGLSLILCFCNAMLLPVQPSMHGWRWADPEAASEESPDQARRKSTLCSTLACITASLHANWRQNTAASIDDLQD